MWETGKDESLTCHKGGVIEEVRYLSIPTSHPENLLIPHYNHTEPPMNPNQITLNPQQTSQHVTINLICLSSLFI
jgi:hypothetical protein